ncbi:conserved Plasmodium protein, unknown function [Plasmodium berghei]|uniref:Uncharacterized protein n=2 Tax=Plasmodium berghei TaxID=5821 RepID=A0A509AQY0_PLABA|nr:conserved protein, unknown function [Plasmodium berghei ANKA]CXI81843.1 conserved Plasmodium protein, unknown function [Plasmodium berghei]SCM25553.1 conserved Plasmodium protein, unknown function [Plasmodium berghei]SCN27402.1 conserved Plasmodium protein, unknown function [Plasmodium berghei]SCO62076.1 conserved Plasmodium protein, unknown function [Plasmodium berghei]SCO63829.1 conserved Plasmodium protein, unknown function [Plasmodium berghei]|eukprot:XP_034423035.1 conserved protein, unknown function [Plasmodium berghei ANKA]
MGINSYFMKYIKITYICRRRNEMKKTIENLKNNIYTYNNYCCHNIIYHINEQDEINNSNNCYNVKVDKNVEEMINLISPLNFYCDKNIEINLANEKKKKSEINKQEFGENEYNNNNKYILKYKINELIGIRGKREQYRYTYLKSPFKYKYALRHYVFEKYKYNFYFFNITHFNINIIFNIILSSMTNETSVKCNINWFYPGEYLFQSEFLRNCFKNVIEDIDKKIENCDIREKTLSLKIEKQLKEIYKNKNIEENDKNKKIKENNDGNTSVPYYSRINLSLNKYNIQDLLPIFFQNKSFTENYKKLILLEEKSLKQTKNKIRKKNAHWFLNQNSSG